MVCVGALEHNYQLKLSNWKTVPSCSSMNISYILLLPNPFLVSEDMWLTSKIPRKKVQRVLHYLSEKILQSSLQGEIRATMQIEYPAVS